ncbi:hypothetical protein FRC01_002357 [Tulasnella sp. 417]|nr:hypothetical protein FRC01_002357 [Tulasnella sp. 417]
MTSTSMIRESKRIAARDGVVLDQAVVEWITKAHVQEGKLEAFAPFFIPEDRLSFGGAKSLGKGGFGLVKTATLSPVDDSCGVPITVAVKILKADDWDVPPLRVLYRVAREMLVWSACTHEHILKFVGYSFSDDGAKAYLISPFARSKDSNSYEILLKG